MNTVIARLKIREGKEDEAAEALEKLVRAVEAEEPGALVYACHRSQSDAAEVVFFEVYADDAALRSHVTSPHLAEFQSSVRELFDGSQTKIERFERIGGFARAGGD